MNKVISFAGTKGGILKSTLAQCISTSLALEKYRVAILEGDSQGSLQSWIAERSSTMKPLNITIINHNQDKNLKDEIAEYKTQYDFLFIDLPGESKAKVLTKTGFAYSDLCIFPLRLSHKDTTAFDTNMRESLKEILKIRDGKHFKILPTFAHHSTNMNSFLKNYESINLIDKFKNAHVDRSVYTYFSIGGLTLREYQLQNKPKTTEYIKTSKAIKEIELIAEEILTTVL